MTRVGLLCLIAFALLLAASCSELEKPKTEEFYADSNPPPKQEFRWSNGKMPKSFDPAKASAPPETDIVRAIFDGLTENDPKTLRAIPALAHKWTSSDDHKTWTFHLRQDAKWSNGEKVTAYDFVRSWKRLAEMGEEVSHHELLKNIVGMKNQADGETVYKDSEAIVFSVPETSKDPEQQQNQEIAPVAAAENKDKTSARTNPEKNQTPASKPPEGKKTDDRKKVPENEFGVKATGRYTLQISLIKPDREFPELVAHPIFRPIYGDGKEFATGNLNADIVTSGAFRIFSVGQQDGVTLDRAAYYYDKEKIKLERVRFIPMNDADSALEAYRSGKVDAVTNAQFEPLALKILLPYTDFKKVTHSALNFYEFNRRKEPFNDRRVREALSIAIDRERLTTDEMEGATRPAFGFLPFEKNEKSEKISENAERAKDLLETAGFPEGRNFPKIKLVINRNNIQERIAKAVAAMWKENLNIDTEIVTHEFEELETAKKSGGFDIVRRGIVLPTTDETANMMAIFAPKKAPRKEGEKTENTAETRDRKPSPKPSEANTAAAAGGERPNAPAGNTNTAAPELSFEGELLIDIGEEDGFILTEKEAILEVPAIPLYFPTSYSLVKPYVQGFEMNNLDAPLLKDVRINNSWQPKKPAGES
jgi:oligopeptide transport system substrate-binding protein